jgi:hypothetical protein
VTKRPPQAASSAAKFLTDAAAWSTAAIARKEKRAVF